MATVYAIGPGGDPVEELPIVPAVDFGDILVVLTAWGPCPAQPFVGAEEAIVAPCGAW